MKKLFVLSLAVCLFIFLCFPVLAAQFSDYPGATDVHFPESGDVVSFGYDDEVLFEEAVEVMNVPDNLVMPDDLQPIGEFFAIIEDTDWRVDGQFRQYTYLLHPPQ